MEEQKWHRLLRQKFDDEASLTGDIEFAQQKRLGLFKTILPKK